MVEQVESGREIWCAPALPFKLGKIQTAEMGSITPAVTSAPIFGQESHRTAALVEARVL
jgi:hypothetical protein